MNTKLLTKTSTPGIGWFLARVGRIFCAVNLENVTGPELRHWHSLYRDGETARGEREKVGMRRGSALVAVLASQSLFPRGNPPAGVSCCALAPAPAFLCGLCEGGQRRAPRAVPPLSRAPQPRVYARAQSYNRYALMRERRPSLTSNSLSVNLKEINKISYRHTKLPP